MWQNKKKNVWFEAVADLQQLLYVTCLLRPPPPPPLQLRDIENTLGTTHMLSVHSASSTNFCPPFRSLIKGDAILAGCHSCSVCAQGACWEGAETGVTCDCPAGRSGSLCDRTTAPNPCQNNRLVQTSSHWRRNNAAIQLVLWLLLSLLRQCISCSKEQYAEEVCLRLSWSSLSILWVVVTFSRQYEKGGEDTYIVRKNETTRVAYWFMIIDYTIRKPLFVLP